MAEKTLGFRVPLEWKQGARMTDEERPKRVSINSHGAKKLRQLRRSMDEIAITMIESGQLNGEPLVRVKRNKEAFAESIESILFFLEIVRKAARASLVNHILLSIDQAVRSALIISADSGLRSMEMQRLMGRKRSEAARSGRQARKNERFEIARPIILGARRDPRGRLVSPDWVLGEVNRALEEAGLKTISAPTLKQYITQTRREDPTVGEGVRARV